LPETEYPTVNRGTRSILATPLVREGVALGAIVVRRIERQAFTERQIELLKTFADQAVIAIENVRLFNETKEALERQTATAEILRVISSSPTNVQPVFDTIAESAARLTNALYGCTFLIVDHQLHLAALHLPGGENRDEFARTYPVPLDDRTLATPVARDGVIFNIADTEIEPSVPEPQRERARRLGARALLIVPIIGDGRTVGMIATGRREAGAFTSQQVVLLKTFADQAVIAIENVRLFTELEARNSELRVALDTQTATSDILGVISRSQTDVQPVFEAIVQSAVRLLHGYHGAVIRVVGDRLERVAITGAAWAEVPAWTNVQRPLHGESVHAQAIRARAPLNFADVLTDPRVLEELRGIARAIGYRSLAVVPLLRHDEALGTIAVTRRAPGGVNDRETALLQTFADQAVIAIENVRLFTELQDKNRALTVAHAQVTESLEQQVATGEILKVISQSPTDVQSVFDAIARSVVRLCGGVLGGLYRFDGELIHQVAQYNYNQEGVEAARRSFPSAPTRALVVGRTILDRAVVHIPDAELDPEYRQAIARALHVRSILSVPMLRDGTPIGVIAVARAEPGRFADSQIELLKTFADQAVIAIENVRL